MSTLVDIPTSARSSSDVVSVPKAARLNFIDTARGLAAIMVLLQHSLEAGGFLVPFGGFSSEWVNMGQAGVVTFFLVSGFVIPISLEKYKSLPRFAVGRVARLYPLYLFVLAINLLLFSSAWFASTPLREQVATMGAHMLFLQQYVGLKNFVGASWTLSLELLWYTAFGVLFWLGLNRRSTIVSVAAVVFLVAMAAGSLIFEARIPTGRACLIAACVLGLLFYRSYHSQLSTKKFWILGLSICASVWFCLYVAFGVFHHGALDLTGASLSWLVGGAVFLLLYWGRHITLVQSRPFIWLGERSYSIYLLHPLLISILEKYTSISGWMLTTSAIVLALGLCSWTYRWIELPAMAKASAWGRGKPSP